MKIGFQLVEDWCNDLLENGDKQGRHCLNEEDKKFCCLGRLCELLPKYVDGIKKIAMDVNIFKYGYKNSGGTAYVPTSLAQDIGLSSYNGEIESLGTYLTVLNDIPTPFSEIAQIIKTHKAELFPILKD